MKETKTKLIRKRNASAAGSP